MDKALFRSLTRALAVTTAAALAVGSSPAQDPPAERPHLEISRVPRRPLIGEFLGGTPPADLAGMAHVEGFTQKEPFDGQPATQDTEVYLGYDDRNLYVVFLAHDAEPDKIRARLGRRDNVFSDGIVEIQLDTFHDERRAFTFISNPLGIQFDAIWTEGRGFDSAWDTVWHSEGKLTDWGYVVLMEIPFKSLRFDLERQPVWGLIFDRDIARNGEETFWPAVTDRIEGRLNQAATMSGMRDISPGRNIWLIPYGTGRSFHTTDPDTGERQRDAFDGDIGLDAKFVVKDSLAVDLTANPDFSQVESDQPQVTVNERFEVFFPEKRPFFLENADFFRTPFDLLFTRRIGDPRFGARATGKFGGWSLGAMAVDDQAPGEAVPVDDPQHGEVAWFGVLRARRDISAQSNVGLMLTTRDFGDESNRVGGIDGRFKLDENWVADFQAAYSDTETPTGPNLTDSALSLAFNRTGRRFDAHIHSRSIGPDFRADSGFIPRTDIIDPHTELTFTLWPEGKHLIDWGLSLFGERVYDHDRVRQDKTIRQRLFFDFLGNTRFDVSWIEATEQLRTDEFPDLPMDTDFSGDGWAVGFNSRLLKTVGIDLDVSGGDGINFVPPLGRPQSQADRLAASFGLDLRLGRRIRLDGTWLYAKLTDPATDQAIFKNQIYRTRLNWQYDPRLSVRLIFQYEHVDAEPSLTRLETTKSFNGDLLVTYQINAWTAVYVGYNSNYENLAVVQDPGTGETELVRVDSSDYLNDARQLFFKINYLFQF